MAFHTQLSTQLFTCYGPDPVPRTFHQAFLCDARDENAEANFQRISMDLAKPRRDRFWQIRAICAAAGVLRVRARARIARTRADFERFSEMSETPETEVWSEQDVNFQPRFSSGRRQPIVPFIVPQFKAFSFPKASEEIEVWAFCLHGIGLAVTTENVPPQRPAAMKNV